MKNSYNRKEPKIYQSQYGTWKVRFFDENDKMYRNKTCQTKTDAENLKRAIMRGDDVSLWFQQELDPSSVIRTFKDLAEKWIDHGRNVRMISESCLMNYDCHLRNHIYPVMGKISIHHLKLEHLEQVSKELRTKTPQTRTYQAIRKNRWNDDTLDDGDNLSISYQREILTVACMITTWASGRRPPLIHDNPFATYKLPKAPEHLYDYWRLEEEDRFLDWIEDGGFYQKTTTRYRHRVKKDVSITLQMRNPQELRDIVLFALRTGMRLGEIGAIRNADVDLAQGFLVVRASYSSKEKKRKNTTKSKKARRIEINDDVREILERRKHMPQMDPLFNIHMNSIKFFSRTCRQAGVREIHFHSLRHTCLTNLANGYGMVKPLPLPKVQQIAGHSDIKTTMRYVHADIINSTASLQLSRQKRKAMVEEQALEKEKERRASGNIVAIKKGLRLISSGQNL